MKYLHPLMALLAILSLHFTSNAQDGGQRLRISQGSAHLGTYGVNGIPDNTTTSPPTLSISTLTGLKFESLDSTTQTVGNSYCADSDDGNCGWYKASWIFGDGNYLFFPDNNTTMDLASKTINFYRYASNGQFGPVVYLTEKYHNKRPPQDARSVINVNYPPDTNVPPYRELTRRLDNNRRIDIDYNHEPRVDYPFNMVLSYRKNEPVTTVYYYYNSLYNSQSYNFTSTRLVRYVKTEETNYQKGRMPVSVDDAGLLRNENRSFMPSGNFGSEGNLLDLLIPRFESRLVYNVSGILKDFPNGLTELRVFPVFEVLPLAEMPPGLLTDTLVKRGPAFAAIIVGSDSLSGNEFQGLLTTANFLFGTTLNSLQLGPNDPRYIRGIQFLNVEMKASHDPNNLVVTNIDTLASGQFNVTFKLRVCNEGMGMEHSPTLTFKDLTNGPYGSKPVLDATTFEDTPGIDTSWKFIGNHWEVNLEGFTIVGLAPKMIAGEEHFVPSCRKIVFSILTDEAGVRRLYQDSPRALNVCVTFSAGAGDCSENEPLSKIVPPPPPPNPSGEGLLFYLLIGVIALILWWYFLWRNAA